ncbi:MAG TPA: GGDEF domain-containing protein [Telluria sp.]|nr:GGDEF domain-containing protein [Telluria sp.]
MRHTTPATPPRAAARPEFLIGLLLILLGLTTTLGWLLHIPIMVELRRGLVPMVFNTGLGFVLSGTALVLTRVPGQVARLVRQSLAVVLVLLCGLALCEHIFDARLGIDLASLHAWYDYGNTRPGRMAPNTAMGFILIGSILFLSERVDNSTRAFCVVVMTFCVLAIGLTGLVGYLLAPELLFDWARSARMAVHTASGMIVCSFGLWCAWAGSGWYSGERYFREEAKIRLLGAAILIISSLTIGLTGFVLLQGNLERALESRLEEVVDTRSSWFRALTADAAGQASGASRLYGLEASAGTSGGEPWAVSAAVLREQHVRAVRILDAKGATVRSFGEPAPLPAIRAMLDPETGTELVWDRELALRIHKPYYRDGRIAGTVIVERSLADIHNLLFNMEKLGGTAELTVCIAKQKSLLCFPNLRNARPFEVPMRTSGAPLPMQLALSGHEGIVHAIDYRGRNVLAAFGQIAPGLGIVAKQDTAEAYAGIREALAISAPVIAVTSLLGAMFLFSQLTPLVAKMRRSETAASDAMVEMRTVMEAAGDGIVTIDQHGCIKSVNQAVCRIFGYEREQLVGKPFATLMPDGADPVHPGAASVTAQGRRSDGDQFPLEVSINAVPIAGPQLMVGILRDITVRKALEDELSRLAQHDSLTGLPNRALFLDRLNTALARSNRTGRVMALMFLDLDGFKAVNDGLGHGAGDQVLKQTAARLTACVRGTDTVARLAGDEFTVILENLQDPAVDAAAVARKIVEAMQPAFSIGGTEVRVTASVGLVLHDPAVSTTTVPELLRKADDEMYAVKRAGRNAFSLSEAEA